jgi:hypothetical protein
MVRLAGQVANAWEAFLIEWRILQRSSKSLADKEMASGANLIS